MGVRRPLVATFPVPFRRLSTLRPQAQGFPESFYPPPTSTAGFSAKPGQAMSQNARTHAQKQTQEVLSPCSAHAPNVRPHPIYPVLQYTSPFSLYYTVKHAIGWGKFWRNYPFLMDECMTALDFSTWIMESCQLFCHLGQWRGSYPLLEYVLDGIVTRNIFRQIGILLHLTRQMKFPLHSALFSKC